VTHFFQKNLLLLVILITLLAGFLRFYHIDSIPVSLYWDEAASAYNAYSITQTGKDEYGTSFPVLFRSFEDYKMPGNIYLTAIAVLLFGLNEFSARFSSAFLGTLTVLCSYFLVKELLKLQKNRLLDGVAPAHAHAGLLTAGLLAISPWHIQFSRTGFEANVAVFFLIVGVWFFILSLRKKIFFILSMGVLAVSMYFYLSMHLFLPLFFLGLFIIFRRELGSMKKTVLAGIFVGLFIVLPLIPAMMSYGGLARVGQVNIITNSEQDVYKEIVQIDKSSSWIQKTIHNRRVVYAKKIITNYFSHFSPQFLFISGDQNGRHGPVGMGLLYLWELPFLLIGIILLWKSSGKLFWLVLLWILLAPIPASISVPSPHALRSLNILPMPQLLTALGVLYTFAHIPKRLMVGASAGLVTVIFFLFAYYLHLYYNVTALQTSADWADGYKQLVTYVATNEDRYEKVVVSGYNWQPYIYFLFYTRFDPEEFQQKGSKKEFGKYKFGGTAWDKEQHSQELDTVNLEEFVGVKHVLFALSPKEYQAHENELKEITTIYDHSRKAVFIIAEFKT